MAEPSAPGPEPILVGVLYDFPQHDGGAGFEEAVRLGLQTCGQRLDRAVELRPLQVRGLPSGSEHSVVRGFLELEEQGVLAVIGPSISDNGLVVRGLADAAELACVNYTGGEVTRSHWMFHYQVGSLEEEPVLLAQHLAARGLTSAAVLYDDSQVGRRYLDAFTAGAADSGVELLAAAPVSAIAEDLSTPVERVRAADPAALCYLGLGVAARAVALALEAQGWQVPVVANSALMFGYMRRDWRAGWEGWSYVDTLADDNPQRQTLRELSPRTAAGPVGVAAYDIGRLVGEAVVRSGHLTRAGVRDGFERIKRLPASSGRGGTTMGFGTMDHGALKGDYLVLRSWQNGSSVQLT